MCSTKIFWRWFSVKLSVMSTTSFGLVWGMHPSCARVRVVLTISRMLHTVVANVMIILNVRWWAWAHLTLHLKGAESFLETGQCTLRTQQHVSGEKSGLQDVKRADLIWYWWRSRVKNPDKPKIFVKKNVRNNSYHQFYLVLAKIRINRGLLYISSVLF